MSVVLLFISTVLTDCYIMVDFDEGWQTRLRMLSLFSFRLNRLIGGEKSARELVDSPAVLQVVLDTVDIEA